MDEVVHRTQELMRSMVALAGDIAASTGLNPSDLKALRVLDAAAGQGVPVNTLGASLALSSGAVTALVDRLERHDLVRRQPDRRDRRRVLVVLGPAANAVGASHMQPLADRIASAASALDEDERAAVERYLGLLMAEGPPWSVGAHRRGEWSGSSPSSEGLTTPAR